MSTTVASRQPSPGRRSTLCRVRPIPWNGKTSPAPRPIGSGSSLPGDSSRGHCLINSVYRLRPCVAQRIAPLFGPLIGWAASHIAIRSVLQPSVYPLQSVQWASISRRLDASSPNCGQPCSLSARPDTSHRFHQREWRWKPHCFSARRNRFINASTHSPNCGSAFRMWRSHEPMSSYSRSRQ